MGTVIFLSKVLRRSYLKRLAGRYNGHLFPCFSMGSQACASLLKPLSSFHTYLCIHNIAEGIRNTFGVPISYHHIIIVMESVHTDSDDDMISMVIHVRICDNKARVIKLGSMSHFYDFKCAKSHYIISSKM